MNFYSGIFRFFLMECRFISNITYAFIPFTDYFNPYGINTCRRKDIIITYIYISGGETQFLPRFSP